MSYAGRVNVFESRFRLGQVDKNYEVLEIAASASQAAAGNFGFARKTYKLVP